MAGMKKAKTRLTKQQKSTSLMLFDTGYEYSALSERFGMPTPNVAHFAREIRSERRRMVSAKINWDAEFRKHQAVS
ncbi:hypothetical protein [Rhizobium tumorigenes]|uniref:Uncharacterized protein n=1 Tax=Rhizobium tumorigenes TaxID=2041385 RepID=A0AAF1K223_9HYPH|nr:hypothetical protein [Rhizobium tumorigenes]WFR94117.1 hypothetical protein PR017_09670 [Rhizobium tumorigenes]